RDRPAGVRRPGDSAADGGCIGVLCSCQARDARGPGTSAARRLTPDFRPPLSRLPTLMLKLRNIEKSFRHALFQTFVLRRVSADIADGEFVSIMGPSGAGKSTLLHILGMHDSAWTGEFWLGDHPIHDLSAK